MKNNISFQLNKNGKTTVIILSFLTFCLVGLFLLTSRLSSRPSVVLIIIDALRADKLGCYGFPEDVSLEIDRIAEKGVQFKNVIAQCSWTRPSIGSMLTSLYPRSIGLYKDKGKNYDILHDRYLTLAEILKSNGYTTIGITANPNLNRVFNFDQGFDFYLDSNVIWRWMKPENGKTPYKEFTTPLPDSKIIFQKMLDLAQSNTKRPAYIQILLMEVHERWKLVRPEFKKNFSYLKEKEGKRPGYFDAIKQLSHDINLFINQLLSMPGWENTLFVITSDHGEGLNDHPAVPKSRYHGRLLYESQLNVPLIWYHPYLGGSEILRWVKELFPHTFYYLKSKKIEKPVRLMDLMPTILDYLKIPLPFHIQGKSLLELIYGEETNVELPPYFVAETHFREYNKIAVYSTKWKYIENRDGHEGVNKYELQPMGIKENGKVTDKITEEKGISLAMKEFLKSWEKQYPKVEATSCNQGVSREEVQQLKALGYLN